MNARIRTMQALVRRELWEHRAFWAVPASMSAVLTFLMGWAGVEALHKMTPDKIAMANEHLGTIALDEQVKLAAIAFMGPSMMIAAVIGIVTLFYLLDSLYGDRRDRSILFWRSMPVTDSQTVLSKLVTATVGAPAVMLAVLAGAFVVWGSVAALFGLVLGIDYWWIGLNPLAMATALWTVALCLLAGALILAPFTGWLMLASAWAPRAPFLWAGIPVVAIAMFEELLFNSQRFLETIGEHFERLVPLLFGHDFEGFGIRGRGGDGLHVVGTIDLSSDLLLEPRLWIGVAIGAAFVVGATYVRRYRDDATY
jgi:ABC-2 type transport system permease protein